MKLDKMTVRQLWARKHKLVDEKIQFDFQVDILSRKISEVNDEQVKRFMKGVKK